jgi:hypothetical protein
VLYRFVLMVLNKSYRKTCEQNIWPKAERHSLFWDNNILKSLIISR